MNTGNFISLSPFLQPGSSLPNFVKLDQSLVCVECNNVLQDPMQTACGHRICRHCLEELFIREGEPVLCPVEEDTCELLTRDNGMVNADFYARKHLKLLLVYCTFKVNGCEEIVAWSQLEKHKEKCKYALFECPNKAYGCTALIPHVYLQEHVAICNFRKIKCNDCGQIISTNNQQVHKTQECILRKVNCPNTCGSREIFQKDLDSHLKICPKSKKPCQYQSVGCEFLGTESELESHKKESMANHLALIAAVTEHNEVNNLQLQSLKHENSFIRKEIARQGNVIVEMKKEQEEMAKQQTLVEPILNRISQIEATLRDTNKTLLETRRTVKELQDSSRDITSRLYSVESGSTNSYRNQTNEGNISQMERELGMLSTRVADIDDQQAILTEANYAGKLTWRIDNYYQKKKEASSGRKQCVTSRPFYAGQYGYKMCARAYLNGDGAGKNSHISLFFVIMKGKFDNILMWPFQQKVTFMLMDQTNGGNHIIDTFRPDSNSGSFQQPKSESNIASGFPLFIPHRELEARKSPYLKDGTLFIKVKVDMSDLYDV